MAASNLARPRYPWQRTAPLVVLVPGTVFVLVEAALSLKWRMVHDSPLMMYIAWMMDAHGAVPYRDLVDMNMPGTYLVNWVIGHFSNYSDLGFRIGDLALLCGIVALTARALKPFGWAPAWGAGLLFAHSYVATGPLMSLQREFIMLLPLAGVVAVIAAEDVRPVLRAFVVGMLFGCAAAVKPQALIGLPWTVAVLVWNARTRPARGALVRQGAKTLLAVVAGLALPLGVLLVLLNRMGALPAFFDLYANYAAVYNSVSGLHRVMAESEWLGYLATGTLYLGGHRLWLLPAVVGAAMVLSSRGEPAHRKRLVVFIAGLIPFYVLYVTLQRRFFDYHWLITVWLLLLLSALCLVERPEGGRRPGLITMAPLILLTIVALNQMSPSWVVASQIAGSEPPPPKGGRVDNIATFLRQRLRECETVQPLDGTGGAVHAMLIARAPIATSFLYDSYLYLGLSRPYVQGLRRRFLREFDAARPRFVVYVVRERPYLGFRDTPQDFPELDEILEQDYVPVSVGLGTVIYERVAGVSGGAVSAGPPGPRQPPGSTAN